MNHHGNPNRWLAIAFLLLLFLFTYDGKTGEVEDRTRSVIGCERARVDRSLARDIAANARLRALAAANDPGQARIRAVNVAAAKSYGVDVQSYTARIDPPFACQLAYPKPRWLWITLGRDVRPEPVRSLPANYR